MLFMTLGRKSTVAKDKLYGAISLLPPKLRAKITIDYSKSDAEVYARAFKACIEEEEFGSFSTLWVYFERAPRKTKGLPSWSPDFKSEYTPLLPVAYSPISRGNTKMKPLALHACYKPSPGFETLTMRMLNLGTIARCMNTLCPNDRKAPSWRNFLREFRDQFPPDEGPNSELLSNMLGEFDNSWRTGRPLAKRWEDIIVRATPESFSKALCYTLSHLDDPSDWSNLLYLFFDEDILQDMAVIPCVFDRQQSRYLFETATGEVGFSLSKPTVGDTIVYVPGGRHLTILTGDRTQFLGCASVDGYMNDAFLDSLDEYDDRWEWVTLR